MSEAEPRKRVVTLYDDDTDKMKSIAGSSRDRFNNWVMAHAMQAQWVPSGAAEEQHVDASRAALLGMMELAPRDGVEGMIASLFMAHYGMAQECARRAQIDGQPRDGAALLRKGAVQSTRICVELLDALDRRRGKRGRQNITVRHLHVAGDARAVIGNFNAAEGGGGDGDGIDGEPHAAGHLAGASGVGVGLPPVRSANPERQPVPVPSDAERPMQDARRQKHRAKPRGA